MEQSTELSRIPEAVLALRAGAPGAVDGHSPITVREDDQYRAVIGRHLTQADLIPHVELLRAHRKPLGSLLLDQTGKVLAPYPLWDAVQIIGAEDALLGEELRAELIAFAQIIDIADFEQAATLIRAVTLSQSLDTQRANRVIADQIFQQLRWIRDHRPEIDERNPSYAGCPIRAGASWIGGLVRVDNKRVERIYRAGGNLYQLEEYADLPSLGADMIVQKGAGAPRGRPRRARAEKSSDTRTSSRAAAVASKAIEAAHTNSGSNSLALPTTQTHPAIAAYRERLRSGNPHMFAPGWSRPSEVFFGGADQLPPVNPTVPLGEGGVGVDHLVTVANLLRERAEGVEPSNWAPGDDTYTENVLGAFSAWVDDWRAHRAGLAESGHMRVELVRDGQEATDG